ncbi:Permease [Rubrobacter radiotolerans]|uniref:Permease n=1 Tax=Rubrobacter radiotolerans TaxID=42256 RepID=A0A023WZE6_RUBRA|nr:NCS2 family permease [Rubrobacter radiotolerans]AHY45562.1 Permease [Rubrobacter radiotolerans]MDX5892976.1 NCS2 family permease [Rubrobacter radiotolerans]SMC02842.1 putative MFS transporter, AGZA family, xanthine/uracil permease [Rubrobacter radiotolerans DSM 5868]
MAAFFKFSERNTSLRTELVAGLTTFMTMAYIIFVNPAILATEGTGLPLSGVFFATCVAAGVASIAMGLFANFPVALASGLGLNAVVAFTLILGFGLTWQQAMAVVILEGILVTLLVITNLREAVMDAIPMSLKLAIAVGIGLFIAFIGLKNGGVVVQDPATYLALGDFTQGSVLLTAVGLVLTLVLVARGFPGGILFGIILTGVIGMVTGVIPLPDGIVSFDFDTTTIGGGVLAVPEVLQLALVPVIFALFMTDFFDTMGTVIAVGQEGNLLNEEGKPPRLKRILLVDSLSAVGGGAAGASSVTSYIESGSGVAEGGRTGMTSVVVGLLFLLALPFAPVIGVFGGAVPVPGPNGEDIFVSPVTAPALIIVGFLMMTAVRLINWEDYDDAIPAFLTILTLPLTFNIAYGIGFGFISYVLLKLARGRAREVHPLLYIAAALFGLVFFTEPFIS